MEESQIVKCKTIIEENAGEHLRNLGVGKDLVPTCHKAKKENKNEDPSPF